MNAEKIQQCRQHWESIKPCFQKHDTTAKHLICAVEIAERLLRENNRLEMENREFRKAKP